MSSKQVCPKCHEDSLSQENPYGLMLCKQCGWLGELKARPQGALEVLKPLVRWTVIGAFILFLALMSWQLAVWKDYGLEASFLQIKRTLAIDKQRSTMELGAICNSLRNWKCSKAYFYELVKEDPSNRAALANLAIVMAKMSRWEEARPLFEAYFSLGGGGYDVLLWYGKTIGSLEGKEKGLDWYYFALSQNNSYAEGLEMLLGELRSLNRQEEALSLIAAVSSGHFEGDVNLRSKVDDILSEIKRRKNIGLRSVRLPAFSEKFHFVPVELMREGRLQFFVVNPKVKTTILNQNVLDENLLRVSENAKLVKLKNNVEGRKIILKYLKVGPWEFSDVPALVCDKCSPTLGKDFLKGFTLETWEKNHVEFMTLNRLD